jgi:hypothetical protein
MKSDVILCYKHCYMVWRELNVVILWSASISVKGNAFLFFRWHLAMLCNLISNFWAQEILLPECGNGKAGNSHFETQSVLIRYVPSMVSNTWQKQLKRRKIVLVYISCARGINCDISECAYIVHWLGSPHTSFSHPHPSYLSHCKRLREENFILPTTFSP